MIWAEVESHSVVKFGVTKIVICASLIVLTKQQKRSPR
jgi:hypothetical protein